MGALQGIPILGSVVAYANKKTSPLGCRTLYSLALFEVRETDVVVGPAQAAATTGV